jgi:nudix-type nucleoside diphosphatase (YffH/AdpP family)
MPHHLVANDIKHKRWATFSEVTIRLPDGKLVSRDIEDHGEAVTVLPYDPIAKTVLLVEQFRAPPFVKTGLEATLETIAGCIEDEGATVAVEREAMEEAGVRLQNLELVAVAWSMPGVSTERITLYLATYGPADRLGEGGGVDAEDENIRVVEMSLRDLAALMDAGDLVDMKTLALVQTLRLRRPELFA